MSGDAPSSSSRPLSRQDIDNRNSAITQENKSPVSYKMNFDKVTSEVKSWDFGILDQNPERFAKLVSNFVTIGSHLHPPSAEDIVIYTTDHNQKRKNSPDYEKDRFGTIVAKTIDGLMRDGSNYLDASIYVSLDKQLRPKARIKGKDIDGKEPNKCNSLQ
ncbi:hypothetical protein GcM1_167004 [Golovinomyces cichoracearum]|uniref:Uncharacterized protein n=1 Tax=Golovinomyces cichoracearum TaxID=62708 RepID=A0A420J7N5_9PEZI|nr:hypothetical protein GcM1_167004 [Golovinomyces cichoracearum]